MKWQVIEAALEDLDDHDGKGVGFWSNSSALESTDSSNSGDNSNDSRYVKGELFFRRKYFLNPAPPVHATLSAYFL